MANEKRRKFKIADDVKEFAKIKYKRFKKDNDFYESEKEVRRAYYDYLTELLPEVIFFVVRYGHYDDNLETQDEIFVKLTDEKYIKYLKKRLKKDEEDDIKNIDMLPNVILKIVMNAAKVDRELNSTTDVEDLIDLSKTILSKKIKKMKKDGIDEDLAYDILSAIPSPKILTKNPNYHIKTLLSILYESAKTKEINFPKIIKRVLKPDDYSEISGLITFLLLERRSILNELTDKQKIFSANITTFCLDVMEEQLKKSEIQEILNAYVSVRKADGTRNKDASRRCYLSEIPESKYPKINKIIKDLINKNPDLKIFF